MSQPLQFALNHITSPQLRFEQFLDLSQRLGLRAVEIRNDLPGVEIQDGTPALEVRKQAEAHGVEILSINAVQRFNAWNSERTNEALVLASYARDAGVKALVLCPVNSPEDKRSEAQRASDLREALQELLPILTERGLIGLVEPLGFPESSLRLKRVAVNAIDAVAGGDTFKLVHDTFHHYLADEREFFPEHTGLVHISGVEDNTLPKTAIKDAHRVLVGPADLMDNVGQIRNLLKGGYRGPFSFEPFSEQVHRLGDQAGALRGSMAFVAQGLEC